MFKLKNYFILITLIIIFTLFINACGRKGKYEPDQPPIINITSYTGVDSSQIDTQEELDEWLANPTSFQQIIWWSAYDTDGVIEGYAFRVSIWDDELRGYVPVAVPGFDYINPEGWAYHYEVGADVNIPMDNPNANITIWSQLLHATINFPADGEVLTDEFGNPVYQEVLDGADSVLVYKPVRSLFEVKCIDDSGLESEIAEKHFNSESSAPKIIISSSQGDIDGETVGTGLIIEFTILDFDPLVEAEADRFEFMLLKKDAITNEIIPDAEENYGVWYTVPGDDDRGQAILTNTGYTEPAIIPNTFDENDVPLDSTLIVAKAYDIAGIVSREDTISFVVKEGFHPGTFIYTGKYQNGNDVWILGDNHFVTYQDGQINRVIPNVLRPDGNHFSTPFWINLAGDYTAINSDDLNIYMHWGWFGEFKLNDPRERILNAVKDEETGALYFSEIIYFDLRLDGAPFVYPPLPAEWFNITDDDGTEWLRVPIFYEIGQNAVLYDLASGEHTFEVRAVDLQLIPDPTPAT
ncbi:MAG: hypothetical protein JXB60_00725, partial [Candidatus Cloacimonetes bacterium]|nr:hypothetical protein [Candidatus Cloacimonadota bacterium]